MLQSSCTICTDVLNEDLMACPCGHIYHANCLTRWFKLQYTCPTCRVKCSKGIKLYFNTSEENPITNSEDLDSIKNKLRQEMAICKEKNVENEELKKEIVANNKEIDNLRTILERTNQKLKTTREVKEALFQQIGFLNGTVDENKKLINEVNHVKKELDKCRRLQTMITGTDDDVKNMLQSLGNDSRATDVLATQLVIIKREYEKMRLLKTQAVAEKESLQQKMGVQSMKSSKDRKKIEELEDILKRMEDTNKRLEKKIEKMHKSFQTSSPRTDIINRLLHESPAPMDLKKQLSKVNENKSEYTPCKNENVDKEVFSPMPSPVHPGAQYRKRTFLSKDTIRIQQGTGRVKKGFDGLGGRSTVLMPVQSSGRVKKRVSKPNTISKFVCKNG